MNTMSSSTMNSSTNDGEKTVTVRVRLDQNSAIIDGEDLEEAVGCGVCLGILQGAIYMCNQGHNMCEACWEGTTKKRMCPFCRGFVGKGQRNVALERVIAKVKTITTTSNDMID